MGMRPGLRCVLVALLAGMTMSAAVHAQDRGDTVVRVVGPGERGLARIPLTVETISGRKDRIVVTDFEGKAVVERVPWDGSLRVKVAPLLFSGLLSKYQALWERPSAVIDGPQVELRSAIGMPARLEPFDAHTGRPVQGAKWRSCFAVIHEDMETVAEDGPHTVFVRPGDFDHFSFSVRRAPDGYVPWDPAIGRFLASRYATAFVARYPLRPEARILVKLSGGTGKPRIAHGFQLADKLGGVTIVEAPADGWVRIRGVPFFRDASLTVMFTDRIPRGWETGRFGVGPENDMGWKPIGDSLYAMRAVPGAVILSARLPEDERRELVLPVRLPRPEAAVVTWPFSVCGGFGGGRRGGGPSVGMWQEPGATPQISAKVLRRNGKAAAGAKVVLEYGIPVGRRAARIARKFVHADAAGVARFRGVPGRRARFQLAEPGLVRTWSDRIEVRDGSSTVLREGEGGTLVVRVKDEQGHALPCARVRAETFGSFHVRGAIHSWVADGVQRIDPFTDETGTRTFVHVSPGKVRVVAWWLDRVGGATVAVNEAQTTAADVVVRPRSP